MGGKVLLLLGLAILCADAAPAADQAAGSIEVQAHGLEAAKQPPTSTTEPPARTACIKHCSAAETRCSREVRRARQQCSHNAANPGRDPFTGRSAYTYFCDYFSQPARACGSDFYSPACQARFGERYAACADAMVTIASIRYDCFRTERDAQNFCREELRDCQAACR